MSLVVLLGGDEANVHRAYALGGPSLAERLSDGASWSSGAECVRCLVEKNAWPSERPHDVEVCQLHRELSLYNDVMRAADVRFQLPVKPTGNQVKAVIADRREAEHDLPAGKRMRVA